MRRIRHGPWLFVAAALLVAPATRPLPSSAGGLPAVLAQEPPADPEQAGTPRGPRSDAELDRLTAEVADRLRCPVCRNQSVLESSSELARRMQGVIRDRLAAGESPDEITAYFVRSYGDWILLRPEPEGLNLLVYALPAAALLAGGVVVVLLIRRWSGPSRPGARAGDAGSADAPPEARGGLGPPAGPRGGAAREPAPFSPEEERRLREIVSER